LRTSLATQKQQLLNILEESIAKKLDVSEYQIDQKNKASCQSVWDVIKIQLQIQKQVKTSVLLINESVKLNLLIGQD